MSGFNSFGQPTAFSYGPQPTTTRAAPQGPTPDQIAQHAAMAIEKHNQGLPLNDHEKWSIEAYQKLQSEQVDPAGQAVAPVTPPATQTLGERFQAALTPTNIAIGVGVLVAASLLAPGKSS
jgi:hypothetical protein